MAQQQPESGRFGSTGTGTDAGPAHGPTAASTAATEPPAPAGDEVFRVETARHRPDPRRRAARQRQGPLLALVRLQPHLHLRDQRRPRRRLRPVLLAGDRGRRHRRSGVLRHQRRGPERHPHRNRDPGDLPRRLRRARQLAGRPAQLGGQHRLHHRQHGGRHPRPRSVLRRPGPARRRPHPRPRAADHPRPHLRGGDVGPRDRPVRRALDGVRPRRRLRRAPGLRRPRRRDRRARGRTRGGRLEPGVRRDAGGPVLVPADARRLHPLPAADAPRCAPSPGAARWAGSSPPWRSASSGWPPRPVPT